MSGHDAAHGGAVPPPVDLLGHFRELGRALLPALLIAVIVGGAVFGLRTVLAEKEYSSSIVAEVRPSGEIVPGDAFIEQLRAPFMGLAVDRNVLEQVLSQVDTDWDAETLKENVQLTPGPSPALLVFTVTASTPELAQKIARSMVVTVAQASFANHTRDVSRQADQLQASIAAEEARIVALAPDDPLRAESQQYLGQLRDQLTTLQSSGGDELTVLATPEQDPGPVSPRPVSESLVAALAALIIGAEVIVLWRSWVGAKPNRTWARRISYKHRSLFDPKAIDDVELPPIVAAKLTQYQREGREVLALVGADAEFPEWPVASTDQLNGHRRTLQTLPLSGTWWQQADLADIALAVVIVTTGSTDRKAAEVALTQLTALGVPTGLVVQRARRARRRPADTTTDPTGSEPSGADAREADRVRTGGNGHV
ncbi:hypothetical protein BH10ACT9_BH10ACT9_14720 [soil metagenome]